MERPLAVQQRCSQVPAGPRSAWVYLSPMDPSCSPQDALLSYLNYCKFFPYSLCRWATRWVQQRKSQLTKGVRKARKTLLSEKKKTLPPLCPLTHAVVSGHQPPDGGRETSYHEGNDCPFTSQPTPTAETAQILIKKSAGLCL